MFIRFHKEIPGATKPNNMQELWVDIYCVESIQPINETVSKIRTKSGEVHCVLAPAEQIMKRLCSAVKDWSVLMTKQMMSETDEIMKQWREQAEGEGWDQGEDGDEGWGEDET